MPSINLELDCSDFFFFLNRKRNTCKQVDHSHAERQVEKLGQKDLENKGKNRRKKTTDEGTYKDVLPYPQNAMNGKTYECLPLQEHP